MHSFYNHVNLLYRGHPGGDRPALLVGVASRQRRESSGGSAGAADALPLGAKGGAPAAHPDHTAPDIPDIVTALPAFIGLRCGVSRCGTASDAGTAFPGGDSASTGAGAAPPPRAAACGGAAAGAKP